MLQAAMLAWILLAPAGELAPAQCEREKPVIGSASADFVVTAYLDPTMNGALTTWLELRRFAAQSRGSVRVEVEVVRSSLADPVTEDVLQWFIGAAQRGQALPALRAIDRDGSARVYARLVHPGETAALHEEIGLPANLPSLIDRCTAIQLERANMALAELRTRTGNSTFRTPMFEFDGRLFSDTIELETLRPLVAERARQRREQERRGHRLPQPLRTSSARLSRPPVEAGALLGGVGLTHRLVLFARDEDDASLFLVLGTVLQYRSNHPAHVSLQLIARGSSTAAATLERRLCGARRTHRELEYVRWLATEPSLRRAPAATEHELLTALDRAHAKQPCKNERLVLDDSVSDGPWLDGVPRTRAELEGLASTLEQLDAAARPLSSWLTPRAPRTR